MASPRGHGSVSPKTWCEDLLQLHRPDALEVSHELVKDKMAHFKGFKVCSLRGNGELLEDVEREGRADEMLLWFVQRRGPVECSLRPILDWIIRK